jgi:hypothetical protein
MSYPQAIEYHEALQDPRRAFSDPMLKAGTVAQTPLGLPLALSGGFALTYTVQTGARKFAVRCFHREVPEAQQRYALISAKLKSLSSLYFVDFDFQPSGIRIGGRPFPIVKMHWVEGETLGVHLDRVATRPASVAALRQSFADLAEFLQRNGIAHGDIQNDNVMVSGNALRLIDYDGMFVAGMREGHGSEVGHKHFQHPGRAARHFGPRMDRFSFIVLDVSLQAIEADPSLHRRFREGGQAIIFKANDFAAPRSSEVFQVLNGVPALREAAKKLAAVCAAPIEQVPTLADFVAGRNLPIVVAPPPVTTSRPAVQAPTRYIGAYDVLDATDFTAVSTRVGDIVELVGQIVSVKVGTGKRGRGKGKSYVFINFGPWNKNSVKVTIWSEGLSAMSTRPNESWEGRWISVTGLVDPVYKGQHYGRPYQNVGITATSDSQIVQINEQQAKFRLGRGSAPSRSSQPTAPARSSNQDIVNTIRTGTSRPSGGRGVTWSTGSLPGTSLPAGSQGGTWSTGRSTPTQVTRSTTPSQPARTRNQSIVQTLQATQPRPAPTHSGSIHQPFPHRTSSPQPGFFARIPGWVWFVAGLLLLMFLMRRR